ncbi:MAG: mechanosensitive ion channel family protein [Tannerellaceae bacterium]|nr:mechanosensitive ion channel family protein [Tannerellaceae bacterium]
MKEWLEKLMGDDTHRVLIGIGLFLVVVFLLYLLHRYIVRHLKERAARTETKADDFIIELLRLPVFGMVVWILLKIFSEIFLKGSKYENFVTDLNTILLIIAIGWLLIKGVRLVFYILQRKLDIQSDNNLVARQNLTRMKIFEGILVGMITFLIVAICLMTFEKVRALGVSLLTSAGIAGVIVGLAAQKSIGAMLAGIQIAITQPIRLDDVVVVEGEWGRIEEITLTYVVVKIWDERRLVLPVTYFMEKPFQNWTRSTASLLGTVFLYVDYSFPVDALRKKLTELLQTHPKWDRRVANIQVTDSKQNYKELRVLLSSINSSINWDLRVDIREKLVDYINAEFPGSFVRTRLEQVEDSSVSGKG